MTFADLEAAPEGLVWFGSWLWTNHWARNLTGLRQFTTLGSFISSAGCPSGLPVMCSIFWWPSPCGVDGHVLHTRCPNPPGPLVALWQQRPAQDTFHCPCSWHGNPENVFEVVEWLIVGSGLDCLLLYPRLPLIA